MVAVATGIVMDKQPKLKLVREVLDIQRKTRTPDIEVALLDFLELSSAEQMEFLCVSVLEIARQTNWAQATLVKMLEERK